MNSRKTSVLVAAILLGLTVGRATAQIEDGGTPLGLTPGAPAGSYPVSDLERVNLFNGSMSFYIPLLTIGGRGEVKHTVGLTIERQWGLRPAANPNQWEPRFDRWRGLKPGYGPGALRWFHESVGTAPSPVFHLTRLAFTAPGETQYELRDVLYEGQPRAVFPEGRGLVWHTSDGTAMTFRADADPSAPGPAGELIFRDGRHYRIDEGRVTRIRDRNGNLMQFEYYGVNDAHQVRKITDSANRVYDFTYDGWTGPTPVDTITYKGFGGAPREIRIEYGDLGTALDSDDQLQTLGQLFPNIDWSNPGAIHNPKVATRVYLPDGREYFFLYNSFGELEHVDLPTGGVIRYAHAPAVAGGNAIYRRFREKTVFAIDGMPQMRTTYSSEEAYGTADQYVDEERWDIQGANGRISRTRHYFFGRASNELEVPRHYYPRWWTGKEFRTEIYDSSLFRHRTVDHTWVNKAAVIWVPNIVTTLSNDPRITETVTRLETNQVSRHAFEYDTYNNRTATTEHAFGAGAPGAAVRRTQTFYLTAQNGSNYATDLNIHIRDLPVQESVYDYPGPTVRAYTDYEYDNYLSDPMHAPLVARASLSGHDPAYVNPSLIFARGNRTAVSRWLDTNGTMVSTYQQYDVAGNVVKTIDAINHATTFTFGDRFGGPDGEARQNTPPGELDGKSSFAFVTGSTNAKGHTTFTQFDYHLGQPVDHEDANAIVASAAYDDPMDRPTEIIKAAGPPGRPEKAATGLEYTDVGPDSPRVDTYSDKDSFGDGLLHSTVRFDSLGRQIETRTYESANAYIVSGATTYDSAGRVRTFANPYRPGETVRTTTTSYDALDRERSVVKPDGAMSVAAFTGSIATVADPAGKVKDTNTDALGRIVSITENPGALNYVTTYSHDVFGNVTQVVQGTQQRSYAYDSLGRLICASMPESRVGSQSCATLPLPATGVFRYVYDGNGNLTSRQDARGVVATFLHDELDRIFSKSYSGGTATPSVTYAYDTALLGKGKLSSYSSTISGSAWGASYAEYDAVGRVKKSRQTSASIDYNFEYSYNHAGNLTSEKYPSGRVVATTHDVAGRARSVGESGYLYGEVPAATDYFPHGAIQNLRLGAASISRWRISRFNCHLQQRIIGLGSATGGGDFLTISLGYGTNNSCQDEPADPGNNGDLLHQQIQVNGITRFSQDYTYDGADRLATAVENRLVSPFGQVWTQSYAYDRFGNRAVTGYRPEPSLTPSSINDFNAATNRISIAGWGYDNAGDLLVDGLGRTFAYDAEQRQVTAGTTSYVYDGEGRRVRKTISGTSTTYVYDAFGRLVADYGQVNANLGTRFLVADHLGSTRLTMNERGEVMTRHDFLPFGEELPATPPFSRNDYGSDQTVRHRFTSKERDLETGLDYFIARHLSSPQGRFTAPDDPLIGQTVGDPQSWNLYSYTGNSPLNRTDPDGHFWFTISGQVPVWIDCERDAAGCQRQLNAGWSHFVPRDSRHTRLVDWMDGTFRLGIDDSGQPSSSYSGAIGLETRSGPIEGLVTGLAGGFLRGAGATAISVTGRTGVQLGGQRLLGTARDNALQGAKNAKLRNVLNDLFKSGAKVGSGSTADAIRHELRTGVLVGGKDHMLKGVEYRTALLRLLRSGKLDADDQRLARRVLTDLQNALSGQ